MHPNPAFRKTTPEQTRALLKERSFGTLAINGASVPLTAHVPFLMNAAGSALELHLVRSNPIARAVKDGPSPAVFTVMGPDSYISPDWYETKDQVPTWNYIAIRLTGRLHLLPQEDLRGVIDRLSAQFEERLSPKQPWRSDKMTPDTLSKMMRAIVPLRFDLDEIESTWKLGQNKAEAPRLAAAYQLRSTGSGLTGIGHETERLADWMTHLPQND